LVLDLSANNTFLRCLKVRIQGDVKEVEKDNNDVHKRTISKLVFDR